MAPSLPWVCRAANDEACGKSSRQGIDVEGAAVKHPWIICGLRWRAWSLIAVVLVVGPQKAWADAQVTGNCGVDKVKGRPGDYVCFYEWNVYSSIDGGTSAGSYFRVGLPPSPTRSYYSLTLVPGTH